MINVTLTRREKHLLAALVLLAGAGGFFRWVHVPLVRAVTVQRSQVQELAATLERERAQLAREGDLVAREAAIQGRELAIGTLVPGRHAGAVFVHYLSRIEQQAGVQISSLRAGERKATGELVEVTVELAVTGTFPSHILFQQSLQGVPLFFSLPQWKLDRDRGGALAQAGALAQQGRPWEAEALLRDHPRLQGQYQFRVYFRPQQPGPDPAAAGAVPATGRPDPFLDDLIDEFFGELERVYNSGGSQPALPVPPPARPPQLG